MREVVEKEEEVIEEEVGVGEVDNEEVVVENKDEVVEGAETESGTVDETPECNVCTPTPFEGKGVVMLRNIS